MTDTLLIEPPIFHLDYQISALNSRVDFYPILLIFCPVWFPIHSPLVRRPGFYEKRPGRTRFAYSQNSEECDSFAFHGVPVSFWVRVQTSIHMWCDTNPPDICRFRDIKNYTHLAGAPLSESQSRRSPHLSSGPLPPPRSAVDGNAGSSFERGERPPLPLIGFCHSRMCRARPLCSATLALPSTARS